MTHTRAHPHTTNSLYLQFLRMRSPEHYAGLAFFYLKALLLVMAYVLDARACVWYALAAWGE